MDIEKEENDVDEDTSHDCEATTHSEASGTKKFLDYFGRYERSEIKGRFLRAVREGASTCAEVVESVTEVCSCQQESAKRRRNGSDSEKLERLAEALIAHPDDALALAENALWSESLPPDERRRQKEERSVPYRLAYMAGEPPTDKQIAYLRSLGYVGKVASKLDAKHLIQEITGTNAASQKSCAMHPVLPIQRS